MRRISFSLSRLGESINDVKSNLNFLSSRHTHENIEIYWHLIKVDRGEVHRAPHFGSRENVFRSSLTTMMIMVVGR